MRLTGKQKLVRNQSDFLACLMQELKKSHGSSAAHCDMRSGESVTHVVYSLGGRR